MWLSRPKYLEKKGGGEGGRKEQRREETNLLDVKNTNVHHKKVKMHVYPQSSLPRVEGDMSSVHL